MSEAVSPSEIVDKQLRAYNARDIDAYCALFALDAVVSTLNDGTELARGPHAIREFYRKRFTGSPHLNCQLKARLQLDAFVIDHELVKGITNGVLEVIAIYEVRDALIRSVRLVRS